MTQLLNDFLSGSAAWGVLLTLAAFALGALINKLTGKAIFNPLLLGSIFVIVFLSVCKIPYADYKISAAPVNYLLLPATVALAIPLYEKIDLLKENAAAIIAGISVGTLVSLGSALALALALDLTREQYATLLPKSVTTAISMDVAAELGGIAALTGAIVIVTGIVGALLAETVCKLFHITDPIAKGVGIGTAAHAVGTSKALQMGEVEGHERPFHCRGRCADRRALPCVREPDQLNDLKWPPRSLCNSDDRCQRQKQEGAVGAAACKMRVPLQGTKQMQGAATRTSEGHVKS